MKPFAQSAEQNREPILRVLRQVFADRTQVLEIGSGTGQHAVYFAKALKHLTWQTSDVAPALPGIQAWIEDGGAPNLPPPIRLDVASDVWPTNQVDAAFSANTAHIMGWPEVVAMFVGVGQALEPSGVFALYGPFHYAGQPTSASNARFDAWLRERDPEMGVRNFEELNALALAGGMQLSRDFEMPMNNRTLVWQKVC